MTSRENCNHNHCKLDCCDDSYEKKLNLLLSLISINQIIHSLQHTPANSLTWTHFFTDKSSVQDSPLSRGVFQSSIFLSYGMGAVLLFLLFCYLLLSKTFWFLIERNHTGPITWSQSVNLQLTTQDGDVWVFKNYASQLEGK